MPTELTSVGLLIIRAICGTNQVLMKGGLAPRIWVRIRGMTTPQVGLFLPLIIALPPLFWVVDATHRASLTTLGRDQGIFQYVAWAVQRGAVDYRDVRDVNGPLTHLIHLIFLKLGGADEHRFRVLDLLVTGITFAVAGALVPFTTISKKSTGGENAGSLGVRLGWALAAWVVLSALYLQYLYWDLAQRESFFDWFLILSVALQLFGQSALIDSKPKARHLFIAVGALSAIPWFGKPTFVLFTLMQLLAILLDDEIVGVRKSVLVRFSIGAALGVLSQLLYLWIYGDFRSFLRVYLVDVPTMYRFILPRSAAEIFSLPWAGEVSSLALVTSLVTLALIYDRQLPRRTLSVALLPILGIVSVLMQAKGFPYHFHPVSMGLGFEWILLAVWIWERFGASAFRRNPQDETLESPARFLPFLIAGALAVRIAAIMPASPHIQNLWILAKAQTSEERASHDYLIYFRDRDFFPWEMRQTAAYLREQTQPSDRVQVYGMDPYVLFLAERLSATPYIYAYDLNADAALGGSWMPTGSRPNDKQAERIRALRDRHERDLLVRLRENPPAAFVFMDKAPLLSEEDAWLDFQEHNQETADWVREHYRETAAFGENHVWLRNGLAQTREPKRANSD